MKIYTTTKAYLVKCEAYLATHKIQDTRYEIRNRCGFTVAEVLLVVVLIALIGGIGSGFYIGTHKKMLVEKAGRDLLLAAKYARIIAIERQIPCEIKLDEVNNGFLLVYNELNEEAERVEQVTVRDSCFKPVEFVGDVEFEDIQIESTDSAETANTDDEKTIVFSPNGTAQSAVIQIGDGRNHITVSICAATGRATIHIGTAEEAETGTVDLDEE